MDHTVQLMFALQSPIGLRFGATQKVSADRITFEMDVVVAKGETCPFRMELTGLEDTVMGAIRIDRLLPTRGRTLPVFIGKIVDMPEVDKALYDGWRRDQATGGISRQIERDPASLQAQMSELMRGATEAETRVVLERMGQRSIYNRTSKDIVKGDPFGLDDESVEHRSDEKRDSMRHVLRAGAAEIQEQVAAQEQAATVDTPAEPEPVEVEEQTEEETPSPIPPPPASAPSWLRNDPTPAVAPPPEVEAPQPQEPVTPAPIQDEPATLNEPEPEPEPEPAPTVSPPMTVVDTKQQPIGLTVIYLDNASFQHDWNTQMHTSGLTVNCPELTTLYLPVKVTFRFPDGDELTCMAQTVANTPDGTAIALELDTRLRLKLASRANV